MGKLKFKDIRYAKVKFVLKMLEDTALVRSKASAIRGGIGEMLLRMHCIREDRECGKCGFKSGCTVQRMLSSEFASLPVSMHSGDSVGYIIYCGDGREHFRAGSTFSFELVLFGSNIVFFSEYINALYALGVQGIGRYGSRFAISEISVRKALLREWNIADVDTRMRERDRVTELFTDMRTFTRLENGVASTGSLRSARCIRSGYCFLGEISCPDEHEELVAEALQMMKWLGNKRASLGGYCRIEGNVAHFASVPKRDTLGISIEDKRLFRQTVLEAHQTFKSYVLMDDDVAEPCAELIRDTLESGSAYIGSGRTAGYGRCMICNVGNDMPETLPLRRESYSEVFMIAMSPLSMRDGDGRICGMDVVKLAGALYWKRGDKKGIYVCNKGKRHKQDMGMPRWTMPFWAHHRMVSGPVSNISLSLKLSTDSRAYCNRLYSGEYSIFSSSWKKFWLIFEKHPMMPLFLS